MFLRAGFWALVLCTAVVSTRVEEGRVDYVNPYVQFRLYSNEITEGYLNITPESSGNFSYNENHNYIFLVHGEGENGFDGPWYSRIIRKYMMLKDHHVIAVGYGPAFDRGYDQVVNDIRRLGFRIGEMMIVIEEKPISPSKFVVVGHGIGAQIAGYAAGYLYRNTTTKVKKFFAIDPNAIPGNTFLRKEDVTQLVVIHTSDKGTQKDIGHVDFYPNGGLMNSVCAQYLPLSDHQMGLYYFTCSVIRDCRMYGTRCDDFQSYNDNKCAQNPYALMGYGIADDAAEGKYYLYTSCIELQSTARNKW